jgi:predicted phosphodiesterase
MIVVGDIHGKFDMFRTKMKHFNKLFPTDSVLQVGDLGIGFPKSQSTVLPSHCKFIRGNHDHPLECKNHPNYLGDYGITSIDGHKIFYLGGAWSIDRAYRKEGVTWWPDEELSIAELNDALELFIKEKPEIVITHDGPNQITHYLLNRFLINIGENREQSVIPTRTGQALSAMFDNHQPKLWLFGHWHTSWTKKIKDTQFICINELDYVRIEDIQ